MKDEVAASEADAELCVVLINAPAEDAAPLARALVERKLAACVNVIPAVTSIYFWEGAIQQDQESTLLVKTRLTLVAELTAAVKELHSYTVPEVIALPLARGRGNAEYLGWLRAETKDPSAPAS